MTHAGAVLRRQPSDRPRHHGSAGAAAALPDVLASDDPGRTAPSPSTCTRCRGWRERCIDPAKSGGGFTPASSFILSRCCCSSLAFPDRRDIVASAWGVLAFGDGMATLVGRRSSGPRIPWNPEKSVAGSIAFILLGGAAGSFLCWWCRATVDPSPYLWFSIWMPWLAAIGAAAVETIPIKLDDNISVPAFAGAVLWFTSLISEDLRDQRVGHSVRALPLALAANGAVAALGYFGADGNVSGSDLRPCIGTVILLTAGWGGWGLLLRDIRIRGREFAARVCARNASWHRRGTRRTPGRRQRARKHRALQPRPPCSRC